MNPNEEIEYLFFYFTNPYNNNKVCNIIEKLQESEQFESEHIEDLKNHLILKEGGYQLHYTYDQSDLELIKKVIEEIKN